MKRFFLASTVLCILAPMATQAATVEELTAQINTLLQQVTALQQSLGQTVAPTPGPVSIPPASTAVPPTGQCPLISRTLKKGSSGNDVTRLQQFLARDPSIYPEARITGFYGDLTEAAVKKFQCKNQIVCDGTPESTGYGIVGPRTAAILALQCPAGSGGGPGVGTSNVVSGGLRVTPTSGGAPLNVSVEVHANIARACGTGVYELFFGDNSAPVLINAPNTCNEFVQAYPHVYTTPGTYTIVLRSGAHQTTATVVVGGQAQNTDTISASPSSGNAPLNVSFTGRANGPLSCSPAAYSIQFGDGTTADIPVSPCAVSNFAVTHTYQNGGDFVARLMRGSSQVDSVSVAAHGGSGGSPQGTAPFDVTLGYGGDAFAVQARFELASTCTAYDIDWGDGTPHATQSTGSCGTGTATKEVSHTYAGAGSYTITLKRGTGSSQTTNTAGVTIAY